MLTDISDRVNRGGSWNKLASFCRSANRDRDPPSFRRHNSLGYFDSSVGISEKPRGARTRGKDYREILSPDDFTRFARLRDLRKEVAQAEAVPVYIIFTNEQLAQIVETRARTRADLERIAGVGDARIEKYGPRFLEILHRHADKPDETSDEPV